MSQAFVREGDAQWLHDVAPSLAALRLFLTGENNGIRVYEQKTSVDVKTGREIYHMSNGLLYTKDEEGRWSIVW